MAQANINIGTSPDSYNGESIRSAFDKSNRNFTELYSGNIPTGNLTTNTITANTATITGNISAQNLLVTSNVASTVTVMGNVYAQRYFYANGMQELGGNLYRILPNYSGDLNVTNFSAVAFYPNIVNARILNANTSANLTNLTATGDAVFANASFANITVGNANIAGLVFTSGNITTNSNVEARSFIGNGRALTDVSAARVVGGETNIAGYGSAETSRITFSGRLVSEANLVTFQVPGIDGNSVITANGDVSINGNLITNSNVTAPYFIGNGALLTGISVDSAGILAANSEVRVNLDDTVTANISNNVKLSLNNTVLLANVDFIPEGDAVYSLGNSTNQWRELYVSQNTIYINRVPVSVRTVNNANVLYVNNNPVLSTNSNTAIETSANVTANVLTATTNIQSSGANLANVLFSGFGNVTANNVTISGNLTVLGDTTTLNVEQLSIEDKVITIGRNATTKTAADGSGIELAYGDAQGNVSILYSGAGTDDRWVMNRPLRAPNIISNTFVTANGNLSLNDNNITFIGNSGQGAGLHWSFETDFANIHFVGNNDASTNYLTFTVGDSGRDAEAFRWRQLRYDNVSFPAAELYANFNNSGLARLYLYGGLYANGVITTTGNISGGNLNVNANATVVGNITTANITVNSNLSVGGVSAFNNNVVVANTASLTTGNLTVNTNTSIGGNLTVGNVLVTDGGVVTGNWRVQGTLTSVNQTQLTVDNINILVANGAQQPSDTDGAGLLVAVANANIVYDYANDSWDINKDFRLNGNNIYANNAFITTNVEIVSNTGYFVGNGRYLTGVQAFSAGDVRDYLPTHDANVNAAYYFGNGSQLTGMYGNLEVAAYLPENTSNVRAGNLAVDTNISASNFSVNNSGSITGTLTVGSIQSANILDDFITVSTGSATPADTTGAGLRVALTDARLEYDQPRDTWLINRSLDAGDNDITAGNLSAAGISGDELIITGTAQAATVTATGNVTAANVVVGQTLTAQGNITTQSNVNAVGGTFTGAIHSNSLTVDTSVTGSSFSFSNANIYSSGNRIFTRHLLVNSEFTVTGAFGGNSVFRSPVINWDTFTQHGNATFSNTTFSNNVAITANLSVTRLLSAYNLATTDTIAAGGNITANGNIQAQIAGGSGGYVLGNGRFLTGVTLSSLQNSWTRFAISDEGVPAFTDISALGNNNVFWEVSNVGVMRGGGLNTTGNITTAATLVGNIIQANTSITTPGSVTANAVTANAVTVGDITANNFTTNSGIVENDLTVRGNLFVQGDRTIVNVQELAVEDINITIANGAVNATAANGAGFTIAGANVGLTYLSATNTQQLGSNVEVTGQLTVLGNINSANIVATANIATTANVSANFFVGNGRFLAGIDATLISNANASVRTLGSNSVVITLGDNVNSIVAEGNGNITANGNVSASYFLGNGRLLSGIDTTLISSGLANVKTFDTNVVTVSLGDSVNAVTYFGNGNITANGNVSASYFLGNGRLLSGIDTTLISNGNTSVRVYADNNVTIQNASVNVASISREGYATFKTLTVSSDNPYEQSLALAQYSDFAGDGVDIIIERGRGNLTARANVQANDQLFHIWSNFYRGTGTARAMTIDNYITANGAANISLQLMNNNYSASSRVVEFQASNTLFTSNLTAANIHSTLNLVANVAQISGNITATANANIGNIVTGALSTTGNITTSANANIGNLTVVTNISANTIDGSGNITLANNRTIFMNNGTANISLGLLNIITTPADGEFLMYDAANAVWINATFDSGTY